MMRGRGYICVRCGVWRMWGASDFEIPSSAILGSFVVVGSRGLVGGSVR